MNILWTSDLTSGFFKLDWKEYCVVSYIGNKITKTQIQISRQNTILVFLSE